MRLYDVLFVADHFALVTTIQTDHEIEEEKMVDAAWQRLSDEYGNEWINMTKQFIKSTSIEGFVGVDDSDIYTIPEVGDATDAGIAGE